MVLTQDPRGFTEPLRKSAYHEPPRKSDAGSDENQDAEGPSVVMKTR